MTGVAMHVGFDDSIIKRHLALLAIKDAQGFASVRREIGEYLVADVQDNLDNQRLFDKSPMPQSKAARLRKGGYVKSKKTGREYYNKSLKGAGKTLIEFHHLYDSYVYQLSGTSVEVGSALVYAAIHHFGGETGRTGHRFNMAARPVLGIGAQQEAQIGNYLIADIRRTQS